LPHYVYILFLTVRSKSSEVIEGLEVGADDFLSKPVRQDELLARMRAGARIVELEHRLSRLARIDQLTQLMPQRVFYECLEKEWQRARRVPMPLSCVMLDIDFFKRINDVHGHPTGDEVLKIVSQVLRDSCRASDSPCRYGGEEFCVMLPETDEGAAAVWAERVRRKLAELAIPAGDRELRITASFGIAQKRDDTHTAEELVDRADQALLCAKHSGRDRVVCFESLSNKNNVDLVKSEAYGNLFHGISARHVMTPLVACLQLDETVGRAAEFFLRSRINSAPVVDADGKMVGMVSEKDIMGAMVSLDCWRTPIREVMKPNVIWYEEETPIQTIYEFLCRVSIRRVMIAKDDRPTGAITRGTLLRWFRNLVVSNGLLQRDDMPQDLADASPDDSKQRLAETAHALGQLAEELWKRLEGNADDLVPYVVGGASRMQELVNDLLAYSRWANETSGAAAAIQSMMSGSSHTD
jgi:diguanylate cyclase (GGDEF)-like protein